MRTSTPTNRFKASPETGGDATGAQNGKGKDGGTQTGKGASSLEAIGLHLLTEGLRAIPYFEMGLNGGHSYTGGRWNQDLLTIVDTEEKQLQCIEDLYAIYRAQPQYAKSKEANWSESTKPVEIIGWLLRRLGRLTKKGEWWTVDTWHDGETMRYMFVNTKDYPAYKIKYQKCHVTLDFLPTLKKKDLQLHDMVIDMIALVSKCNMLPLWDEDQVYSSSLNKFITISAGREDSEFMNIKRHLYTKGSAYQYLKLIKARRKKVTIESLDAMLCKYKPASERKRDVCYAVHEAISLAKTKGTIAPFDYSPNYNKGIAMPASDLYKFIWSHDPIDPIYIGADIDYPCGMFLPTMHSIAKPGQVLKPIENSDVPVKIFKLMERLNRHFWAYRNYYYTDTKPNPNDGTLINVFEKIEVKELMQLINVQ